MYYLEILRVMVRGISITGVETLRINFSFVWVTLVLVYVSSKSVRVRSFSERHRGKSEI